MEVPNPPRSGPQKQQDPGSQAGIWITLVGAIIAISAFEHLTKWPWYVTYPLALIAGLIITAAYLQLKSFLFRKS